MKALRGDRASQAGLTLIETLVAILIFGIVTLGTVPLIASSIRGSVLARSYTGGKNVAVEFMEKTRGLPFFVGIGAQPTSSSGTKVKVDLLDMYFPCAGSAACLAGIPGGTFDAGTDMFKTVCTPATVSPACNISLPNNYTVEMVAAFVKPLGTTPEQFDRVDVSSAFPNYAWNGTAGLDTPPARMLHLKVTAKWRSTGVDRSFTLESYLSERKLTIDKVLGNAKVDYVIQVSTSYVNTLTGERSNLVANGGNAEARIETRQLSQADISATAGQLTLVEEPPAGGSSVTLADLLAARSELHAPPDQNPGPGDDSPALTLTHPDLVCPVPLPDNPANCDADGTDIAFIEAALVGDLSTNAQTMVVRTANEIPFADGGFRINSGGVAQFDFWVAAQADVTRDSVLLLDRSRYQTMNVRPQGGSTLSGRATAFTGSATTDHRVQTTATGAFNDLRLFPVTFIPGAELKRSVVLIEDFTTTADCKAAPAPAGSTASASYSALLKFWVENDVNDGKTEGHFYGTRAGETPLALSDANTTDPLANFRAPGLTDNDVFNPNNPMVYEDPAGTDPLGSPNDVYLFGPTPGFTAVHHTHLVGGVPVVHDHPFYLTTWQSLTSGGISESTSSTNGASAQSSVNGAIKIVTSPTNPLIPETGLTISVGRVSCEAVDRR